MDPQTKESLGPLPILFVRYLYVVKMDRPPAAAMKFVNHANMMDGGLMGITAVSMDELNFGHGELKRGQTFVMGQQSNPDKFSCSVLFPAIITEVKKHMVEMERLQLYVQTALLSSPRNQPPTAEDAR